MFSKSVNTLSKNTKQSETLSGMKILFLAGTILATSTPGFANELKQPKNLNFNVETIGEVVENIITVQSSEGASWDTILDGEYKIRISGDTNTEIIGKVSSAGLFPGHCLTNQCNSHPSIWTANPNQPIIGFEVDIDLKSSDLLTANANQNTSPASWLGEQMIAECNARLGEDGPTIDQTIPVSLPFSFVINSDSTGDIRQTATAEFLLNCMAFDGQLAELQADDEVSVASIDNGGLWTGSGSSGGSEAGSGIVDEAPFIDEDPGVFPEEEEEEGDGFGVIDLSGLFPLPFPEEEPVVPEVPEIPEEPVDPVVNPGLGEMPDDLASPDGGIDPDPGPDPTPGVVVLFPPIESIEPVDPKVNPGLGKLPGDLTAGINPTHSGKKNKAEKKAIRDALKKKRKAKLKKKAKQKQALLNAQRKKQDAKKKRKAEKKALRDALKKKAKKKKKVAKRANPKPAKKKVLVKKAKLKKAKIKRAKIVKRKTKKNAGKKIVRVQKTKIKIAPVPAKKRTFKAKRKLKKKQKN